MAVRTVTEAHMDQGHVRYLKLACVANSSDGLFADYTVTTELPGGRLVKLVTDPGATAPAAYTLTLKDARGVDIFQGLATSRHATNTEELHLIYASTYNNPVFSQDDVFIFSMSGSTKNSAIFDAYIFYALGA